MDRDAFFFADRLKAPTAPFSAGPPMPLSGKSHSGPQLTLHQMRIVWAVAHAQTVSRAAKQLGLSQPSLSQQIAKLEANIGQPIFVRGAKKMALTEIGAFLVQGSEQVMREMQALEDGLSDFTGGTRTIGIAGITSPVRVLLPQALQLFGSRFPDVGFDLHESTPADVLAMLYARRVNIGIVAASSIAQSSIGFVQVPLLDDPYVLVVPESLDLSRIETLDDLAPEQRTVMASAIQFVYGSQHQKRIEAWYGAHLPGHRVVARCRSFEVAVALVQAGVGVCLAPALSCMQGDTVIPGIRLHHVALDIPRQLVALVPSQYRQLSPYAALIETLQAVGQDKIIATVAAMPPFLQRPAGITS